MNRQGGDRKSGTAEDSENSDSFGKHENWVGTEATLLDSTLIPDDTGQTQM
jgi:hypothetical protein